MRHHSYASLFEFTLLAAALSGCGSDNKPGTGGGGGDGASSVNYGASSVVMTSPDGSTWTNQTTPTTAAPSCYNLSDVVWNGSKLLAAGGIDGSSRVIISSADGITLMQEHLATLTGQTALSGVASSSSLIIAVGGTRAVTSP